MVAAHRSKYKITPDSNASEEFDVDLGLLLLRARLYDPERGRFRTLDRANGRQIAPITLNRYLYADGDPVNLVDPLGLEALEYSAILNSTKGIGAVGENFLKTLQQSTANGTTETEKILTQTAQFYRNAAKDFDTGFKRDYGAGIALGFVTACEFQIVTAAFDLGDTGTLGDPGVCVLKSPYPDGPFPPPPLPGLPPIPGISGL